MTDLFVHVRMQDCCRKALAEIDDVKKGVRGTGAFKVSLAKALGDKTVPEARSALATTIGKSTPEGDKQFTSLKKKTCAKAAAAHAAAHKGQGETTAAALWEALAAVFDGKSVVTQPATSAQASGNGVDAAATTPANAGTQDPPHVGLSRFVQERGFTVTSTTGGHHNPGSAHGQGRAIDVRTRDHTDAEVEAFIDDARAAGIDVRDERTRPPGQQIWSGPHLHLSVPAGATQ
jgi:hypothetical protein